MVIDEFAAVVDVEDAGAEREALEDVQEGAHRGFGATIPSGGAGISLGNGVGEVEKPEEAFFRAIPAKGDGIDLKDTDPSVFIRHTGTGGNSGGEGGFAAGTFVRRALDAVGVTGCDSSWKHSCSSAHR